MGQISSQFRFSNCGFTNSWESRNLISSTRLQAPACPDGTVLISLIHSLLLPHGVISDSTHSLPIHTEMALVQHTTSLKETGQKQTWEKTLSSQALETDLLSDIFFNLLGLSLGKHLHSAIQQTVLKDTGSP